MTLIQNSCMMTCSSWFQEESWASSSKNWTLRERKTVISERTRAGRERRKNRRRRRGSFPCPREVAGMRHDRDSLWPLRKRVSVISVDLATGEESGTQMFQCGPSGAEHRRPKTWLCISGVAGVTSLHASLLMPGYHP